MREGDLQLVKKAELENFSSVEIVAEELRSIELKNLAKEHLGTPGLEKARNSLMTAIEDAQWSRYCLGKALEGYRAYFKADRIWMEAAAVIARGMHCDSRTVRNIISDYHEVKLLPESIIEAAHSRGIDLAKKRHFPLAKLIQAEISDTPELDGDSAQRIVAKVIPMPPAQKSSNDDRFEPLNKHEKARWKIRMRIRAALNNVQTPEKLNELVAALEEEMFAVWGQTEPVTITITPRPSPLTLDGRKRKN